MHWELECETFPDEVAQLQRVLRKCIEFLETTLSERSRDMNLLTACDLDWPMGLALGFLGFLGRGTMNLPSFERASK